MILSIHQRNHTLKIILSNHLSSFRIRAGLVCNNYLSLIRALNDFLCHHLEEVILIDYIRQIEIIRQKLGSITKLVGFRIPDIFPPAHVK